MLDTRVLGERIRKLRKAKGLTQGDFAKQLHVSFQAVSNWERGVAPPELDNLVRIAAFFEVLVDDLLHADSELLCLGVDGGGTKTEFSVVTQSGTVLMQFKSEGSNPNDRGVEHTIDVICEGVHRALVAHPSLSAVFCGISGISTSDYEAVLLRALRKEFPSLLFDVKTDAYNLFYMNDNADMALISGTGSVVFVRDNERPRRLGGHGYLIDTEGSAYDFGRAALSLALDREDVGAVDSPLYSLLLERLGGACVWDSIGTIYREGKPMIASLAPIVFEASRLGDPDATAIIERNAEYLASLLNCGVNTYKARPTAVLSGGLIEHYGDILLSRIRAHTSVELLLIDLPPVFGACRAACHLISEQCPENFYQNFKESYRG